MAWQLRGFLILRIKEQECRLKENHYRYFFILHPSSLILPKKGGEIEDAYRT